MKDVEYGWDVLIGLTRKGDVMRRANILLVDYCLRTLRETKKELESKGWNVRASDLPVDPIDKEIVVAGWEAHGPEMLRRCEDSVIVAKCPSEVDRGAVIVLQKGCPISDVEFAVMSVWIMR